MRKLLFLIIFAFGISLTNAKDFVREHDSRLSFMVAHETLVSRMEYNKIRFEMAKDGSMKKRRILCIQIPTNLKDLYEINIMNKRWQTPTEIEKSKVHLEILVRKRNEILLSKRCQGS